MSIEFTAWPREFSDKYRDLGLWQDKPLTDILRQQLDRNADAIAIIENGQGYSYRQLDEASERLAKKIRAAGVPPGSKALVQLPNGAEFYAVYFALLKAQVAAVYALFSHNRLELQSYFEQLQPEVFIASRSHSLFADDDYLQTVKAVYPCLSFSYISAGEINLNQYWPLSAAELATDISISPELQKNIAGEVAFFQLSGGSTGIPKLIPRTHNDYLYSIRRSVEVCQLTTDTKFLCCLPAGHNFTLSSPGALGVFLAGGTVVTSLDVSPVNCLPLINLHRINMAALVPSALLLWVNYIQETGLTTESLKLLQVGGAKLDPLLAQQIETVLGAKLQQVYGMAEGLVNYTRLDDDSWHVINTQGRPMCEYDELRVVDEEGYAVASGEAGELQVRGAYTFRGYYQAEQHNQGAFTADGFYCTGDLVTVSEKGYVQVVGRVKDQINRGGEKIAAEEVETLLNTHEDIQQAAIVSIPDVSLGEKSCAFLVMPGNKLKAVQVRKFLRQQGIAAYKIPDRIVEIDRLPLTAVGKIDKKKLRNEYQH